MKFIICSSIDQLDVIEKENAECFFSCQKKVQLCNEWKIVQCCQKDGWCCAQVQNDRAIRLFIPGNVKRQNTKTYYNAFLDFISEGLSKASSLQSPLKNINDIIVHNSKNIHTNIVSKFESIFPDLNQPSTNKILNIQSILSKAAQKESREILSIWKSLNQQTFQYSLYDFLETDKLDIIDFGSQEIYKLVQMAFYQYEDDFVKRKIRVNMFHCDSTVYCNFDTTKAAFCSLFENCLKYCLDEHPIDIEFLKNGADIVVKFTMCSRVIEDFETKNIFDYSFRGKHAQNLPGKGIGMWLVKRMMDLNYSKVEILASENPFSKDGNKYGTNCFLFTLNTFRKQIIEKAKAV